MKHYLIVRKIVLMAFLICSSVVYSMDIKNVPFSTAGSFLKIATSRESGRLLIASIRNIPYIDLVTTDKPYEYYEIAIYRNGEEVVYTTNASPACLILSDGKGKVTIAFLDNDTFIMEGEDIELHLLPVHAVATLQQINEGSYKMNDFRGLCIQQVRIDEGTLIQKESFTVKGTTGPYNDKPRHFTFSGKKWRGGIRLSRFGLQWNDPIPSIENIIAEAQKQWEILKQGMPRVPEQYRQAAESAWYINHSSRKGADVNYTREVMLMSNLWMNKVWSWDNLFNALAMVKSDKELAFDQMRVYFDKQSTEGIFPDAITEMVDYIGMVKPPIWGWAMLEMKKRLPHSEWLSFAVEAYEPIARNTNWWFMDRDPDGNGLCEYNHGNDSGWDNGTLFDQGYPTEGADLSAHLTLQMEALSVMAEAIGEPEEAALWKARSEQQMQLLLALNKDGRFFSPLRGKKEASEQDCLLNYIPLALGHRLPQAIVDSMSADLVPGGRFLTRWGLATQAVTSSKYREDGYWRGPIWAPSTYLIFTGLLDAGRTELAREIAMRFCDLCAQDNAMWENYEAITGRGLQCPAYTWTSSVFLLLAEWLGKE